MNGEFDPNSIPNFQPSLDDFQPRPRPVLSEEEVAQRLAPYADQDRELMGYTFGLDRGGMFRTSSEVAEHFGMTGAEVQTAQTQAMVRRLHPENDALTQRIWPEA